MTQFLAKFANPLIPFIGGLLLLASPQAFTKATGDALQRAKARLRKIGFLLLGVAAIYTIVAIVDPPTPPIGAKPQTQMHRVFATTQGESGWYLAESTEGSFSVLMPIPFNDFTVSVDGAKLGTVKTFCIGNLSKEGFKFSAVETPLVPGKTPPNLDEIPSALASQGEAVTEMDKTAFLGRPSISLTVEGPTTGAFSRHVLTPRSIIIQTLEYPVDRSPEAAKIKDRFLNSLRPKRPDQWAPKISTAEPLGPPERRY